MTSNAKRSILDARVKYPCLSKPLSFEGPFKQEGICGERLSGKTRETSIKPRVFAFLDANASVFTKTQLHEMIERDFNLTANTAKVYVSKWRKSNGVSRRYTKKEKKREQED